MKRIQDFKNIKPINEYPKIIPGGYVCRITGVKDYFEKEYLKIEYDIAEGELRGYYLHLFQSKGFWGGKLIRSYKESAKRFFKGFINAVEDSNEGYHFDFDENTLVGNWIGLVLAEEEYKAMDNTIKKRLYVHSVKTVEDIRKSNFTIPELKTYQSEYMSQNKNVTYEYDFYPVEDTDDDLPF